MQAFLVEGPHFGKVGDLVDCGMLTMLIVIVKTDLSFVSFRMKPTIRSSHLVTLLLRFLVLQYIAPQVITIQVGKEISGATVYSHKLLIVYHADAHDYRFELRQFKFVQYWRQECNYLTKIHLLHFSK